MTTIHILFYGTTPCSMQGVPSDWPPNHVWVPLEEWYRLSTTPPLNTDTHQRCSSCDKLHKAYFGRTSAAYLSRRMYDLSHINQIIAKVE